MEQSTLRLRYATREWMRADLLKAVYAALLTELPRASILEFWSRHPFTLFHGPLPPGKFLRYLWEPGSKLPPDYFWSVLADLEAFLAGKGISADRFFHLFNHGQGGGPPLDPDWVMGALPSPLSASPATDPFGWLLTGLPDLTRTLLPGCRMEGAGDVSTQSGSRIFVFHPLAGAPEFAAVPDFRLFPGKLLQNLPKLFGCAAFNRLDVEADMRGPAACLGREPEDAWNWKGHHLHFRQRRMGRMESLDGALEALPEAPALRSSLGDLLTQPILRMEKDFTPAGSKEPRLRAGRIYGSPVFIIRIGQSGNRSWDRLAAWLKHKPQGGSALPPTWEVADRLHRELIDALP
jgi:hypothetical protein